MLHRREFIGSAAAIAAAPLLTAQETPQMISAIDTHQHLWDLTKFKLNWLKKGSPLDAQFTPKEYDAAIKGLNVVKSVYMEVDVVEEQQLEEVDYVTELCKSGKTTMVAAVVSGRPASKEFPNYISRIKDNKYIKGLRQVLHVESTKPGFCLSREFVTGVRLLGEVGLSFDFCMRYTDLHDAAKLAELCPDTRFILDHCGNPRFGFTPLETEVWKKGLAAVAERKNVMCKVSGFLANGWKKGEWKAEDIAPIINTTIETFGVNRCMFGGDWPVVTAAASYGEWLTALRAVLSSRPVEDQKRILHDNAAKFYGI